MKRWIVAALTALLMVLAVPVAQAPDDVGGPAVAEAGTYCPYYKRYGSIKFLRRYTFWTGGRQYGVYNVYYDGHWTRNVTVRC